MSTSAIKQGIINSTIPSAVSDRDTISTAGTLHEPFLHSDTWSTKIFMLPTGATTTTTTQAQLLLKEHAPASTVDIVLT
jgi:hypothetical protein